MEEPKTNNDFKEGQVCPTHDCFSMWQKVWTMQRNKPIEVRIVSILYKGFHRSGWAGFGQKKEILTLYKVTDALRCYDESRGVEIHPYRLFATKEALLKSL